MIIPVLLAISAAAPAQEAPILIVGRTWAPFISPMGEPFRAKTTTDDTLRLWIAKADANRDGAVSLAEMLADADRFFTRLDDGGDGALGPDDIIRYEWEIAPDIQIGSPQRRAPGVPAPPKPPETARRKFDYKDAPLQGAARYALLNFPQPVAAADSNFDRSITRAEFRAAATYRFQLLDTGHSGALTFASLDAQRAKVFADAKKRAKRKVKPGEEDDERVGGPL
ncbi:MAG: hypothetical protein ABIO29_07270 [Sphingomicrobium sp.]